MEGTSISTGIFNLRVNDRTREGGSSRVLLLRDGKVLRKPTAQSSTKRAISPKILPRCSTVIPKQPKERTRRVESYGVDVSLQFQ